MKENNPKFTSVKIMDHKTLVITISDNKTKKCYTLKKGEFNQENIQKYIERFKKEIKYGF